MDIEGAEFFVMTAVCFCATARVGVIWQADIDTRVVNGAGVLVSLPPGFRERVGDLAFLKIVQNKKFDSAPALLTYSQSSKSYWSQIKTEDPWIPYQSEMRDIKQIIVPNQGVKHRVAPDRSYLDPEPRRGIVDPVPWRLGIIFTIITDLPRAFSEYLATFVAEVLCRVPVAMAVNDAPAPSAR